MPGSVRGVVSNDHSYRDKVSYSGCRHRAYGGRQHVRTRHRERPNDPAWSETLACAYAPCAGTGRSRDRPFGNRRRSASGRRGAVADDARSREVRLCHSSWEADEQSTLRTQCRITRVIGAGAHTASSPSHTQGGSRVPELGPLGSVRGALSNERPYRDLRNVVAKYLFETSHRFAGCSRILTS